jgi:hypothetical protein
MRTSLYASNPEIGSVLGERAVVTLRYSKSKSTSMPVDTNHSNNFHTSPTDLYVAETTFPAQRTTHFTDVFEHADNTTTTRTVIRPMSAQPGVTCFPKSNTGHIGRRRRSPIGRRLNCVCNADAFEQELDFSQQEREKRLAGLETNVQVRVYKEKSVFTEEKWRDPIRAMLYGRALGVDSVVGRVEVC